MSDRRLIEEWMPITEIGIESVRERTPMTPFPAPNRLHVWWARRPLVASRAAILGALLPPDADHQKFLHVLGIHGDPVKAKRLMANIKRGDQRITNPYGYSRAFGYVPTEKELEWIHDLVGSGAVPSILDPTAGGGSIPFEAIRLGCNALANDLNPVAWLILKATVEFPARYGSAVLKRYEEMSAEWGRRVKERVGPMYPKNRDDNCEDATYLWARTVKCPYCGGIVPLSPNWRLDSEGTGVKLVPVNEGPQGRSVRFEIVHELAEQSPGTVSGGNGSCPFPDCGRVIDGDEIKAQAQSGQMAEQLYAVVYKEAQITGYTKAGKPKVKKVRGFRAPRPEDDVREQVQAALDAKLSEWQARNMIPDESIDELSNYDRGHRMYGAFRWADMFSLRQLYGHCTSIEVFHDLVDELGGVHAISDIDKAALVYLCIAMGKMLDYNSRYCTWIPLREVVGHTFQKHNFAMVWAFAEMAPTVAGLGYDWVIGATSKALEELIELSGGPSTSSEPDLLTPTLELEPRSTNPNITITNGSGDSLPQIADASVDAVVMDPPYYDNVMYAELSDFFYVWLKRTAGLFYPEQFSSYLTDKDREAVANVAKFKDFTQVKGTGGARKRASRDYQERMQAIFAECRRVLKPDGVMVLMFTHKATGAWDALARGLLDAGFMITASPDFSHLR